MQAHRKNRRGENLQKHKGQRKLTIHIRNHNTQKLQCFQRFLWKSWCYLEYDGACWLKVDWRFTERCLPWRSSLSSLFMLIPFILQTFPTLGTVSSLCAKHLQPADIQDFLSLNIYPGEISPTMCIIYLKFGYFLSAKGYLWDISLHVFKRELIQILHVFSVTVKMIILTNV